MAGHESTEPSTPLDRRRLIAGGLLAAGTTAAATVLGTGSAQANTGNPLVLGLPNSATDPTSISTSGAGISKAALQVLSTFDVGVAAIANGATANSLGVFGVAGPAGIGVSGAGSRGVQGASSSGDRRGVVGIGYGPGASVGVEGLASSSTSGSVGVRGSTPAVGGAGVSGRATAPAGEAYGVLGTAQSWDGRGVFGVSLSDVGGGTGVFGQAQNYTGVGVRGIAYDGDPSNGHYGTGVLGFAGYHDKYTWPPARPNTGVIGISPTGTGVLAESFKGVALRVQGKVTFSRSGRVVIAAGRSTAVIPVPGGLGTRSNVSATPQSHLAGVFVNSAVPDAVRDVITIHLSKAVPAGRTLTVAWFVNEY